jgi:hypothetical protein
MTSDADVWRIKRKSAPSRALISPRNPAASRVISKNPSPDVSIAIVAVAMVSTRAARTADGSKAT